ncbi:isochorismatase family protein [Deinococcus navajonensis]|uniref:Isochorismatase family protein n=1 Tax=Deinococcus navajonensis TaxID=309884 RepID=A0ABV8XP49_9DEIO
MTLTPTALVLLNAQRHYLEEQPNEHALSLQWQARVEAARRAGHLVVFVQWNGEAGTSGETFTRGWVLHPDFRAQAGELLVRATSPDAFEGSDLNALLHSRAVRVVMLLSLPGSEEETATAETARQLGYTVDMAPAGR